MLRYGVNDLRLFFEGDLRFLGQFNAERSGWSPSTLRPTTQSGYSNHKNQNSGCAGPSSIRHPEYRTGHLLTMAGLEVEESRTAPPLPQCRRWRRIVEARSTPTPTSSKLCKVDAGTGELLQIVCGAPNAAPA